MTSPRVQVTLTPTVHGRIARLAQAMGVSKSALIADLVSEQSEVFDDLAELLVLSRRLSEVSEDAQAHLLSDLAGSQEQFDLVKTGTLEDLDALLSNFRNRVGQARAGALRAAARNDAARGILPPSINKGARMPLREVLTALRSASEGGQGAD